MRVTDLCGGMVFATLLLCAGSAGAQQVAGPAVSLSAGARAYDRGEALVVALRAEYPLARYFLLEGAGSVADPAEGATRSATSVFEVQAQAHLPGGRIVPYVGVGGGFARFRVELEGQAEEEAIVSASVGARVGIRRQLSLVADARVRATAEPLDDPHADVTVGLRYRFR